MMPMWAREKCLVDDVKLITLEDDLINVNELQPTRARQRKNSH